MKKTSNKIIFFGNERLSSGFEPHGAPTLQALISNGYNVVAVVANYQEARSRKARKLEVQEIADRHNIPVLLPTNLINIKTKLQQLEPAIGVLVAYGRMVPQAIIDIFPFGIVNIHPSLLPLYRGSTPIEQAILDGASKTGVSLMSLVRAMDAGPLYAQTTVVLSGDENKNELTHHLLQQGGNMLLQTLPAILSRSLTPKPQKGKPTFCGLIVKGDGILNTTKTAQQLEREVRAYQGWPKSRTTIFGQDVIVTKSRVATNAGDGSLILPCGNQTFLEILELIAPSGRRMAGADFKRGYQR